MSKFLTPLDMHKINSEEYVLNAPLKYVSSLIDLYLFLDEVFDYGLVVVPAGFKTDLASIPFPLNRFLKRNGPWGRAAVIHDYLCKQVVGLSAHRYPGLNRKLADAVFREAMVADGVNSVVAWTLWAFVRLSALWRDED